MDIFQIADDNTQNLSMKYDRIRRKYESINKLNILNNFLDLIKSKATISINMAQVALGDFLVSGKYKNVYEYKKENADALRKLGIEVHLNDGLKKY